MQTALKKDVLTTGEVARICHVAPRTVSKWFDTGKLRGYRIPGSRDRRIPLQQLVAFMRAHGIPLNGLDGGACRIMFVDPVVPRELIETLASTDRYAVRAVSNQFEAGVVAQDFHPHVVILDVDGGWDEAAEVCNRIKSIDALRGTIVVAAGTDVDRSAGDELISRGFDGCISKPYSAVKISKVVECTTDLIG